MGNCSIRTDRDLETIPGNTPPKFRFSPLWLLNQTLFPISDPDPAPTFFFLPISHISRSDLKAQFRTDVRNRQGRLRPRLASQKQARRRPIRHERNGQANNRRQEKRLLRSLRAESARQAS